MNTAVAQLQEGIRAAAEAGTPIRIRGGGSKDFYGRPATGGGKQLSTRGYAGIVAYEPTELFVTARCGTSLAELEKVLADGGQMLAFEPPHFGEHATVGGMVACGLAGPRRAQAGALRDFVLGASVVDGRGDVLKFGGRVMKNVAGYDVSRLMTGGLGSLGLLLEVTLKAVPKPPASTSLRLEMTQAEAITRMNEFAALPLPVSATAWHAGVLSVRLCGSEPAVAAARKGLGGETLADADAFWRSVREQRHGFFTGDAPLWRLALPSTTPPLDLTEEPLLEWNGGLRWLRSGADPARLRALAEFAGGHATLFRAPDELRASAGVFQPLAPPLLAIHRRLKESFDPKGIFNPGRMYADF